MMLKKMTVVLALLSAPVFAQQPFSVDPRDPNTPAGATGPAVQYTQRITGTVIAVGSPLYQNVPVGQTCQRVPLSEEHRPFNRGTVAGAAVGTAVGLAVGDGSVLVAAATGSAGGLIGNRINRRNHEEAYVDRCSTTFEQRIVGWTYTAATFEGIQVQGVMRRQPVVGSDVTVIVVQKFYAGE